MRINLTLLITITVLAACMTVNADTTDIAGAVFGLWDSRHSEYHISGDIWVPADSSLTIIGSASPVSIIFDDNYEFRVERGACLRINIPEEGDTAENRVTLTSPNAFSVWQGLRIDNADPSTVIYNANIQFASQSAIYIDSSDVRISGCNILNNLGNAAIEGGGIYSHYSDITVHDCLFEGNSAGFGGGIYCNKGSITIENNIFYSNVSIAGSGGGALLKHIQAGSFKNNLFLLNQALLFGGGMAFSDTSTITIENNTLYKNIAEIGGGIVSVTHSEPTLRNCILWQDSINQVGGTMPEIYVTNNGQNPVVQYSDINDSLGYLDSTNINQDPLFINPSIFLNLADFNLSWEGIQDDSSGMSPCIDTGDPESAKDPDSSRIDLGAYPYYHPFHLLGQLDQDTLKKIYSPYYVMASCSVTSGKAIEIEAGSEIKFRYSSYNDSNSLYDFTISDSASLHASGTEDSPITFTRYDSSANWKGLKFMNADSSYLNYIIIEYVDSSSALTIDNSYVAIDNSLFQNNNGVQGGAINSYNSILDCRNSSFITNKADYGGAMYIENTVLNLLGNMFEADSSLYHGGAIFFFELSDVIFKRNVFWKNSAASDGGAIYCDSLDQIDRTKFTNNTFYLNRAGHWGGAIYVTLSSAFDIKNSIFWNNIALDSDSRHIYLPGDSVTYTYCDLSQGTLEEVLEDTSNIHEDPLFIDRDNGDFNLRLGSPCIETGDPNMADYLDPDGTRTDMGAKHFPQGMGELSGSLNGLLILAAPDTFKVTGDVIVSDGDTLVIEAGVTLNFMDVYDITVENSGLLYGSGDIAISENDSSISRIRFTSFDTTAGWGSIIFNNVDTSVIRFSEIEYSRNTPVILNNCGAGVIITQSTFNHNYGDTGPGAIRVGGGMPEISFNDFHYNQSQSSGGALLITDNADAVLNRNVFWRNEAYNYGGGLHINSCNDSMNVFNNTFCDNESNAGGAIYVNDCAPLLLNNILWLNTANFGPELYVNSTIYSPIVDYCDILGGYPDGGDSIISSDPLFADQQQGDFRITWQNFPVDDITKSPCIDAGHPDTSWFIDDDTSRIDIGAIPFNQILTGFPYVPGDANMLVGQWPPQVIGSDVTYLVSYFRGLTLACLLNDFYCSADANGDCQVIGSDVTRLVGYFRGAGTIEYCADYEPAWPTPDEAPTVEPAGWPGCETPPLTNRLIKGKLQIR